MRKAIDVSLSGANGAPPDFEHPRVRAVKEYLAQVFEPENLTVDEIVGEMIGCGWRPTEQLDSSGNVGD